MGILSQLVTLFGGTAANAYQRISAVDARTLLNTEAGAKLVDVRTEGEYRGRHIAGSVLLPLTAIAPKAPALLPNKQATIIVHCQSGHRSGIAVRQLLAMGYTRVYDLGGIANWPYGTVSG